MTRKDLTEIVLVVDRSASMAGLPQDDAEAGINTLIDEQKSADGEANFTLVQFDTEYDFVHNGVDIQDVESDYELKPRGSTALLDAIGRTINETGDRLSAMDESDRPGLVIFTVVTDGYDNKSVEFKLDDIKSMVETQTNEFNWQFNFLGADLSGINEAQHMGFRTGNTAVYDKSKAGHSYRVMSNKISTMRSATISGAEAYAEFTEEEREEIS